MSAQKDTKTDAADMEPDVEATSPTTPTMTPLQTDSQVTPEADEPIAQLPEEATDMRFEEKKIETVLVTGATGGVGKYVLHAACGLLNPCFLCH